MKKILVVLVMGLLLSGCAINQSALNLGTNFSDYATACKKVSLVKPKLVSAEGSIKVYTCPDGSQSQSNRYEVFENNKLTKVYTREWTESEKQASFNQMLLGLSLLSGVTAKAKGLSSFRILFVHALPNALNPVVTSASGWLASMLAGAVFVEFIFGWNGLGKEIVYALNYLDLPVVMGAVLTLSICFVIITIFTDLLYYLLDPKIRG